jgi:hypothetical protein
MIFLLLCILSSTLIFVIFRYLGHFRIPVLPVIIYNYLVASITGFSLSGKKTGEILSESIDWLPISIIIGVLFIVMFFIIGKSSQVAGISITTVASKMSVVTPIVFSLFIDPLDDLTTLKSIGIFTALIAVFLTIYKKPALEINKNAIVYPVLLFVGMGIVDSLVKYAQLKYIEDSKLAIFSAILFFIAFLTGLSVVLFRKGTFRPLFSMKTFIWGAILGLSNFGSIYFLIRALNYTNHLGKGIDSSVVFGVNNTGIVILSIITGYIVFREKLERINYLGIFLALIAILIFSYA